MKQIDQEKFKKTTEKARVHFGLTYWGKSNNMRVGCQWNDRPMDLDRLTDEQVVLLWQLVNSALGMLAREQAKRDLLPDEIAKMYRLANTNGETADGDCAARAHGGNGVK